MKTLIIAEKPELGRAIATALQADKNESRGVIRKGDLVITWAYGHLLRLQEPDEFDEKYKQWRKEDLPIVFENWPLVPDGNKKDRVQQIGELIKECDQIIHAGDPDDEGQFLIDEILIYHKNEKPVKRVYINDNTPALILKSFKECIDNDEKCMAVGQSAYARAVADYVVGINYTRLFSIALRKKAMSVGRVQSPTLGMIVKRDLEVDHHHKQKYYELKVTVNVESQILDMKLKVNKEFLDDEKFVLNRNTLVEIEQAIQSKPLKQLKVEHKIIETKPPLPYNLAKLQATMNTKYGYDLSKTDKITQTLRDKYQAITYNRSDSQYLKEEHFKEAQPLLSKVMEKLNVNYPLDYTIHSECFNDQFVSAHHAIIPTASTFNIKALSKEEYNVYLEICQAYLMQFMPPIKKQQITSVIKCEQGDLRNVVSVVLDEGYKKHFKLVKEEDESDDENGKVLLEPGKYDATYRDSEILEKETNPPKRYTQATLIKDMTSIAKYVESKEIQKILKEKDKDKKGENGSIGTSATRSSIVETLIKRQYVEMQGKNIVSTPLGKEFYKILPDDIKTADCTAKWWVIQEDIKEGKATCQTLVDSVVEAFRPHLVSDIAMVYDDRQSLGTCPLCGNKIVENKKAFGCINYKNGCRFTIWKNDTFFTQINKEPTAPMISKLLKDHYCQLRLIENEQEVIRLLIMRYNRQGVFFELTELPKKQQEKTTTA